MTNSTRFIDHGRTLVNDITGSPRNYLHEISIRRPDHSELPSRSTVNRRLSLQRKGYRYALGWRDAQNQAWDLWTREEPLKANVS